MYKKYEKLHLRDVTFICYNLIKCLGVHQHLWDHGGIESDVHKGQIGEEEVQGCVQVGVLDNGQDDEQVPKCKYNRL
jgi:hypothetical protein